MANLLIVDCAPFEMRVALMENGDLIEAYTERGEGEQIVGNIYLSKVANVLPGMQAAFVDLGLGKNAFLYAGDILVDKSDFEFEGEQVDVSSQLKRNIRDMVKQGQEIMVQVVKDASGTKGARVTTHITLPGRTVVLMPTVNYIGVSRRIGDEAERTRLKGMMEQIKPENMGVIVRTVAQGKHKEDFLKEINYLVSLWDTIQNMAAAKKGQKLLHAEEDLLYRTLRDMLTSNIDKVLINDKQQFQRAQRIVEMLSDDLKEKIQYSTKTDLFCEYEIQSKLEGALGRKVWLKSGGYIVIDETEALVVIDVNTGKYIGKGDLQATIFQTNLEAAAEIARQLRLRNISGIIVIDFIDMDVEENRQAVMGKLQEVLKRDRIKSNVLGMTSLGLVEMTRKKIRQRLSATMQAVCPYCSGEGRVQSPETMAIKVRRMIEEECNRSAHSIYIIVNSAVAEMIAQKQADTGIFLPELGPRKVYVKGVRSQHTEEVIFRILGQNEKPSGCDIYC
ncbi:MAG: Rne/Rng family ribonuclease [Christensenellales bacterium]